MAEKKDVIFNEILSVSGSSESSRVYIATYIKSGESEIVIEKTISERYPIQEYDKVIDLHERLNCGSGRKAWSLNEIAHPYNPNKK